MPKVTRNAIVPYSAAQMYELVNAVEDYPAFVPWCSASTSDQISEEQKTATLFFTRGALKTSFTTKNTLTPNECVDMQLVDGPFRHLHGVWKFTNIDDAGCRVELELDFELSNRVLKLALEAFFNQISDRLVNAFVKRAEQVYA